MPDGMDPDDYIKTKGKEELFNLLKKRNNSIFYLELSLDKLDQNNPYEISKFEKKLKTCRTLSKMRLLKNMF